MFLYYDCVYTCVLMCMEVDVGIFVHLSFALLTGRISQLNPGPGSLACLPALGVPSLCLLWMDREVPCPPGLYVASGDPNPGPQPWNRLTLSNPLSL